MKRNFKLINTFIFYFLFIILFMNVTVIAQEDDNKEKGQLLVIQSEVNNIYSKKIEAALKEDIERFNSMKAGADKIEKIKDDKGKNDAVENYQKTHKGYYMKMMNSAGININSILAHLNKKFPDYLFSSPDGISIDVEKKIKEITTESSDVGFINEMNDDAKGIARLMSGPNPDMDPVYTPLVEENAINLAPSKSIDCTLASGGSVTFWSPNSMRATSSAAVLGGCGAKGTLQYGFSVPTGVRYIKIVLSGSLSHNGSVVATGGFAMIATQTWIQINIPSTGKTLYNDYLSRSKYAPLLWIAKYEESRSLSGNVDVTSYTSKGVLIKATTHTYNISEFISSTSGNCQINLPTVKKVFEKL